MKEGVPSFTAVYVAFARALASLDPELSNACRDHVAARLLPRIMATLVARASASPALRSSLRLGSLGMVDHLALRTAIIDGAVERAVAAGARQLVVLGAGLDSRAYRLAALRDCVVFEVDHPSTQALKLRKASGLRPCARELRHAACDFASISLEQALRAQRFDATVPTAWIWEGVVMYLDYDAVEGSLDSIANLSPRGSTLIATYVTPRVLAHGQAFARIGLSALALMSEPVRTAMEPATMRERVGKRGFEVQFDALPEGTAHEHGVRSVVRGWAMPDEHVVIALKS